MKWKNRHWVLGILFGGYFLCYMDRMVIATALPFIAKEFQLSPLAMGGVLSAFFVGYALMQIPGGLLVDRLGPRRVVTAAIIAWSFFTALTGAASSLVMLIAIRVMFGMAEAPFPSAASKEIAVSFPQEDVGKANGIQLASVNLGAAIAPVLVAPWVTIWGWRSVFYFLLLPGLLLALSAWLTIRELEPPARRTKSRGVGSSLNQVLKTPALAWCGITLFFGNMAGWGLMNWLPTYLLQVRHFDIVKTGVYASMPFLAGALGYYLGGVMSDKFFSRRRHVPIAAGFMVSSFMTLAAAIAPSGESAICALIVVFFCFFISLSGLFTMPLVLAPPQITGGVFGIVNTIGQVAAFLSPLLIGSVLNASGNDFSYVFYLLVTLFFLGACAASRAKWIAPIFRPESAEPARDSVV